MPNKNVVVVELIARFENRIMTSADHVVWKRLVLAAVKIINSRPAGTLVTYDTVVEALHEAVDSGNEPGILDHVFDRVVYPDSHESHDVVQKIKTAVKAAKSVLPQNQQRYLTRITDILTTLEADIDCPKLLPGTVVKSCFLKYDHKLGPRVCVNDLHSYIGEHRDCPMFRAEPHSCRSDCLLFGTPESVASNLRVAKLNKSNTDIYKPSK